jgi:hypothetical protein
LIDDQLFVRHRGQLIGFVSRAMLFTEKAEIRGEEICDMVSIASQATLMS